MNDHNKLVSGVEATANPAPSQGRRRLVKGAIFAVPAIVTLRRASAQPADGSIWCVVTKFDENGNPDSTDSCFISLGPNAPTNAPLN